MFDRSRQERAQVFEGADANPDEIRLSVVTIDEHGSHACCSAAGNVPVELVANEPALVAAYGEPRARVLEDALRRLAPADIAAQDDRIDELGKTQPLQLAAPQRRRASPGSVRDDRGLVAVLA
jgi:hypothetical protein